jgi:Putative adhesin
MNNQSISSISIRYSFLAIALVVLFASTLAVASTPQGTFEKTFQVSGPVDLEVQTHSGDIIVRSGPAGSVSIRGKIYVGDHWLFGSRQTDVSGIEQNPPLRQDGNNIRIDYVNVHDISVDYEIVVPTDTTIRAHTGSGDQTIEGTHGNLELQSGSGDVRAKEIAGAIRGSTGSGNIEVEEVGSGDVDLRTGSGNVTARGIQGEFRAEAGSGDITAEGKQTGAWEIRTGSGNVHVHFPEDAAFDANLSTSSGSMDVTPAITMTVQGRVQETRKQIVGKVRGGGPLLTVRTGSGDIHIE